MKKEKDVGKLLLDTNFLFIPIYYKIDLIEEIKNNFPNYEIIIPSIVIKELEKVKGTKKEVAKEILEKMKDELVVRIIEIKEKSFDRFVLNFLEKEGKEGKEKEKEKGKEEKGKEKELEMIGVCTNDRNLKKKIRKLVKKKKLKNVFIISSSGKKLVI